MIRIEDQIDNRLLRHRSDHDRDGVGSSRQFARLEEPRPRPARSRNVYVDVTKFGNDQRRVSTPVRRHSVHARTRDLLRITNDWHAHKANSQILKGSDANADRSALILDRSSSASALARSTTQPGVAVRVMTKSSSRDLDATAHPVISSQPKSIRSRSDDLQTVGSHNEDHLPSSALLDSSKSIICDRCGRCRCAACARPERLPSRVCGDHCLLSCRNVVDAVSCMCCVKACLYHATGHVYDDCSAEDFYENGVVCDCDRSCSSLASDHSLWSCSPKSNDRCFRWTLLSLAFTFLPCFWLYLPLDACAAGVESAYTKYYDNGCRCERDIGRRSRTLPQELPSTEAARKAMCNSK